MASVQINQMLAVAVAACEDKKAEDIRIFALDPTESGLTDYFLICTGTNDRQTVAITDEIEIRLKREFGAYPNAVEGRRQGEWVLMDYVDFIVHVFLPEKRAYYGLERLRPSATSLNIADLNAEIKAAIASKRPKKSVSADEAPPARSAAKIPSAKKSPGGKSAAKKSPATKIAAEKPSPGKLAPKKAAAKKLASNEIAAKKLAAKSHAKPAGTGTRSPAKKAPAKGKARS